MNVNALSYMRFRFKGRIRKYIYAKGTNDALVILLHSHTLSAKDMLSKWIELHTMGFNVLAPEGYELSWNGGVCCGAAKRKRIDDSGFVLSLTQKIINDRFDPKNPPPVFILGASNGAFLTSLLSLNYLNGPPRNFISGVAMISGYSYSIKLYDSAHRGAFPVIAFHAMDDALVGYNGCCSSSPCLAVKTQSKCFSLPQAMEEWCVVNECENEFEQVDNFSFHQFPANLTRNCYWQKDVYYCAFPGRGHDVVREIPDVQLAVGHFFQQYANRTQSPTASPVVFIDDNSMTNMPTSFKLGNVVEDEYYYETSSDTAKEIDDDDYTYELVELPKLPLSSNVTSPRHLIESNVDLDSSSLSVWSVGFLCFLLALWFLWRKCYASEIK